MNSEFIWPDIFTTGVSSYPKTKEGKGMALADANTGWGICMSGCKPIDNFGKGMAAIGVFLGETMTPENTRKITEEYLRDKDHD